MRRLIASLTALQSLGNWQVQRANSSGAPFLPRIIGRVALSFTQCGMLFESMLTTATPATMAESEKGRRVQRLLFLCRSLELGNKTPNW